MTAIRHDLATLESMIAPDVRAKLHDSAKSYEGVFLGQMMEVMMKDLDFNPMNEGASAADDTYKGMLAQELGKSLAGDAGIGLAQPIYRSLLEAQLAAQEGR